MKAYGQSMTARKKGIATAAIVVVVVVVVAVASVAAFYALSSSKATSTTSSSMSKTKSSSTSGILSATRSSTTSSIETSTGSSGTTYSGSFNYSIPVGPSGERVLTNGTPQYYNSTQVASGTFTVTLAAGGLSGSGSGQGTFTITTMGFCTGSQTIHYTFAITDVTTLLGGNMTIFFGGPTPANYTVPLTCTGDMSGVSTATNNPGPYLAEYAGEITVPLTSLPVSETFQGTPSTIFHWGYSLRETG